MHLPIPIVNILQGSSILILGWVVARYLAKFAEAGFQKSRMKKELRFFVCQLIFYSLVVFSSIAALSEMGIDTSSLLAVIGGGAVAIGLGLKDQLSQLAAGIAILIKHPFRTGDFVTISGITGQVESIDFFQTVIKTLDSRQVILPNSVAQGSIITNLSAFPKRRIDLPVMVSYHDDVTQIKNALLEVALNHPLVLQDPEPQSVISEMKDYGLQITLRSWVLSSDFGKTRLKLMEDMNQALRKLGCTRPVPYLMVQKP